jgi:hypothetical protein
MLGKASSGFLAWVAAAFIAPGALAHHSGAEYDGSQRMEITGTLLEVAWQNPHVHFTVKSDPDATGKVVVWDVEAHSLSVLRRTNVTADRLARGDRIRIAGDPSRRVPNRMFATNLMRADGVELVLGPGFKRRWQGPAEEFESSWFDPGTASARDYGIFRVWSTKLDDPVSLWKRDYPLTEAAQKQRAAWDDMRDTVARGCEPKGMPTIMEQPYPLEFVKRGDRILLRMEEYDTVRTIHMAPTAELKSLRANPLGVSAGRWEGETLVVLTDRITWPHLDPFGVPLGRGAVLVERFTPSADGSRLEYTLTIKSPEAFKEPVELKRNWFWRPQEKVRPYRCVPEKAPPA